jgi:multidrug efflux pump subunit AcrB
LTSASQDGRSRIKVEFDVGFDMETAANDVRDRVSRVQRRLLMQLMLQRFQNPMPMLNPY